jgi:hypothetical protein
MRAGALAVRALASSALPLTIAAAFAASGASAGGAPRGGPAAGAPQPTRGAAGPQRARAAAVSRRGRAAAGPRRAGAAAARHRSRAPAGPRCEPVPVDASDVLAGTPLSVSPLPDSYDASPGTSISLLGAPAREISSVAVSGSSSGRHAGRLLAYSQGDGASFVPSRPFREGETVTVTGRLAALGSRRRFAFRFAVAHEDRLRVVHEHHVYGADPNEKLHFHSAPRLEPPYISVTARSPQTSAGLLFAAPYGGPGASGPMIFDEQGNLVWFDPLPTGTEATNLQLQQLEGRPVLSWWQGYVAPQGFGEGEEVIANDAYQLIDHVRAGNGLSADLHDFHITSASTALMTVFNPIACDLAGVHGPANADVTDAIFQELDLRTGLVRREWHSLDHVPMSDSYSSASGASREWPFDYFHINSLQQTPGGRMLISARNTWTIYELDARTGRVLERIGGRHSSVELAPGTATAYQHDATLLPNGTISIFDNGALPKVHSQSRGIVLAFAAGGRRASVVGQYEHPQPLLAGSQGNIQLLENGDEFIGWGSAPYFSEFSSQGQLLFDAHMPGSYESYRGYRFEWTGAPAGAPAVAASPVSSTAPVTVYASWNGDTRTALWRLLAGASPTTLTPVASAPRRGFETALTTPGAAPYVAVQALDAAGDLLGTSPPITG